MNTADITCIKIVEDTNKCISDKETIEDLSVLNEIYINKHSNNWYDRVYLCYEDVPQDQQNVSLPIKGFKCYRYNSFENADSGWNNYRKEYNNINIRSTMIPICKWVPNIFDKYILNWKLRNMYWLGKHTLGQGYNCSFNKR